MKWDTLVSGHVTRTGTHADVALQLEFMNDLKNAARRALKPRTSGKLLLQTTTAILGLYTVTISTAWSFSV
jgi:hypothetical protein